MIDVSNEDPAKPTFWIALFDKQGELIAMGGASSLMDALNIAIEMLENAAP